MIASPGAYSITNLPDLDLAWWLKGYRDSNGNGAWDGTEAWGQYTSNPLMVTGSMTGIDIDVQDP